MSGKVAIVGAGPAGCFLAQALLKADPALEVDLLDALPTPYGLVRYGVAADHQGTKAVARQFARVFERQGARFWGNVALERDVTLAALRAAYDAVVIATGLSADRKLGAPGENLPGVIGAGRLTRALYEHPDAAPLPAIGPRPLIIGNGNVAIDLLRLLAKAPEELEGSDLGEGPTAWLAVNRAEKIVIVGRSAAGRAKFDPMMVKELGRLSDVSIRVVGAEPDAETGDEGAKRLEALASIDGHGEGRRRIIFRFGLKPLEIVGASRVEAVRFAGPAGEETIACSAVLTAIGFASSGEPPRDRLIAGAEDAQAGRLAPGLYAAGWFARGPRGAIPDARAEAQTLAARILAEIVPDPARPGRDILEALPGAVDYEGWRRIDRAEIAAAPAGRRRAKIATREEMLSLAAEEETTR